MPSTYERLDKNGLSYVLAKLKSELDEKAVIVSLTQAEYNALTTAEKNKPNIIYEITDAGSSSSGGHTILNDEGTELPNRSKLKFIGADITDDENNDSTIVSINATKIVNKPTVTVGSYTYNGSAQGPTITGLTDDMVITNATKINAGTYTLTIALKNSAKMVWKDMTTTNLTYNYTISKKPVAIPAVSGSFTYDNTSHSATITGLTSDVSQSGTVSETNAGTYTIYFDLNDSSNMEWADGTTSKKSGSWEIAVKSVTIPIVGGSYTYDGQAKSATISGTTDSDYYTQSGASQATNAGTYTVTFTLDDTVNTKWSDNSTSQKSGNWVINKANGNVILSKDTISLSGNTTSDTIVISNGTGTISISSDDITIATVSPSSMEATGGILTVTSPTKKSGTATITVSIAESSNYNATTKTINFTGNYVVIYGVEWDGTSTTKWTRTDAAANFSDPNPAVNNGSGSSPFDNISPWKDMVKEKRTGGTMVRIPKFYFKWTKTGKTMKLQIAMDQAEGFQVAPAFMDRGDGQGERSIVYVGRYHCGEFNYKSQTGNKPTYNITREQFRTSIHNLGVNIWQLDYAMLETIWMLYLVEFADWNSQATIGYGCGNNRLIEKMGLTDAMKYHTGTNMGSRTTYGHTQYRNIEDLWGNVYDWVDGIYFNSENIYIIKNPANFSDSSGGTLVGTRPTSNGLISAWAFSSASGFTWFLYPSEVSGSESTYVGDDCSYYVSGSVLFTGGYYNQTQYYGLFYLCGTYGVTGTLSTLGSRIMELP